MTVEIVRSRKLFDWQELGRHLLRVDLSVREMTIGPVRKVETRPADSAVIAVYVKPL